MDERDALRDAAVRGQLGQEHRELIAQLADELDEDNAACAAAVIRALVRVASLRA